MKFQPRHLYRPEIKLLLSCARTRRDEQGGERVRALAREELDWDVLLSLAARHRLSPLLHHHLHTSESVPPEVMRALRESSMVNGIRAAALTKELFRILELFEPDGVRAIVYKGPVLASIVYGDLSLRPFNDLDLLIKPDEVNRASEILRAEGYEAEHSLTPKRSKHYLKNDCEQLFSFGGGQIFVDLHWAIVRKYFPLNLDIEGFRRRAVDINLEGRELLTFSPEDSLLILSVHACKDFWERLIWVCDIAELLWKNENLDLDKALSEAESSGARRMLLLALILARNLFEVDLPREIFRACVKERELESLALWIEERFFNQTPRPLSTLDAHRFHLKLFGRKSDRLRYTRRFLTHTGPGDWKSMNLPDSLFPLYYIFRPVRLLLRGRE